MFQKSDARLVCSCPVCNLRNCKCGFKTVHRLDGQWFQRQYEQACYRCGSSGHSALHCPRVDAATKERIREYTSYVQGYTASCAQAPPPYNHNTSSNRPQCVNCGSQRHCTFECYFPVQNSLVHDLYRTDKQRTNSK